MNVVTCALNCSRSLRSLSLEVTISSATATYSWTRTLRNPTAFPHRIGKLGREYVVEAQNFHRIAVVVRWSPTLSGTDVLGEFDAGFDTGDEGVLHAAQPHRIETTAFFGTGFAA